jgi:regulator of sigma E protease
MIFTIIIAFFSLIGLVVLHELGHFVLAKKFGVRVEEFGIGYPPRLFGKKFGETLYSLNLLPFGAFIKIPGEIEKVEDKRSFSAQPVGKRALIAFGGVLSFWIMAAILFGIIFGLGTQVAVSDTDNHNLNDPKVQIAALAADSPAERAGIKAGDTIASLKLKMQNSKLKITKVKEVQEFTDLHKGEEIILTIERGKEVFDISLVPRVSPPAGEGAMGVALVRTAIKSYPWYLAPWQGISATANMTLAIAQGYYQAIANVVKGLPSGVQLMGPVGVLHLFTQASQLGINYYLQFVGMIAIYIALFNILPIPAVDGGKLLFLGIEALKRKPVNQKVEQNITTIFFTLLIILMIFVTIKDVIRIF